jgi:hypothetical protein
MTEIRMTLRLILNNGKNLNKMEKVLRKVNNSSPNKSGWYFTNNDRKDYFDLTENEWEVSNIQLVQYWYEEVSVDELEDYKVAVGNLLIVNEVDEHKFKETLHDKYISSKLFAKERYEKALKLANKLSKQDFMDDFYFLLFEDVVQTLKIAAGLKEAKV